MGTLGMPSDSKKEPIGTLEVPGIPQRNHRDRRNSKKGTTWTLEISNLTAFGSPADPKPLSVYSYVTAMLAYLAWLVGSKS